MGEKISLAYLAKILQARESLWKIEQNKFFDFNKILEKNIIYHKITK